MLGLKTGGKAQWDHPIQKSCKLEPTIVFPWGLSKPKPPTGISTHEVTLKEHK